MCWRRIFVNMNYCLTIYVDENHNVGTGGREQRLARRARR